jgi:hypothetical protein
MKLEKKLVAYGALAIIIGVASIMPLMLLMSGTATAETAIDKPWFNLNLPYAYVVANSTQDDPNANLTYSNWRALVLNFTMNEDAVKISAADARIEYFEMQIYSDKEPVLTLTYFAGNNRTYFNFTSFRFARADWFDSNTTCGGQFSFESAADFNSRKVPLFPLITGGEASFGSRNGSYVPQDYSKIKNAETLYIDVRKVASVTFTGNSTVVTLGNGEVLQHIELKKFEDGFLYNTVLPENQLSQIDLTSPGRYLDQPKP